MSRVGEALDGCTLPYPSLKGGDNLGGDNKSAGDDQSVDLPCPSLKGGENLLGDVELGHQALEDVVWLGAHD